MSLMLFIVLSILNAIAFIAIVGFGIALIIGASTKSKGTIKTGKIGLIVAGSIFVFSLIGGAMALVVVGHGLSHEISKSYDRATGGSSDSNDDDLYDDSYGDSNDFTSTSDEKTGQLGTPVKFKNGLKITFNSIKDTDEKLEDMKTGQQGMIVNVTVDNTQGSKNYEVNPYDFEVTDVNGDKGDSNIKTYDKAPDDIDKGDTATFDIYFVVQTKGKYSVQFGDTTWHS